METVNKTTKLEIWREETTYLGLIEVRDRII